jgi:hypothetical protein
MSDLTTTVDTYLSAYGEPDAAGWALSWSVACGPPKRQFAEHRFRRVSAIDGRHDQFRFAWELVGPDGTVAVSGLDVGELADDGRLRRITGFFGDLLARDDDWRPKPRTENRNPHRVLNVRARIVWIRDDGPATAGRVRRGSGRSAAMETATSIPPLRGTVSSIWGVSAEALHVWCALAVCE